MTKLEDMHPKAIAMVEFAIANLKKNKGQEIYAVNMFSAEDLTVGDPSIFEIWESARDYLQSTGFFTAELTTSSSKVSMHTIFEMKIGFRHDFAKNLFVY